MLTFALLVISFSVAVPYRFDFFVCVFQVTLSRAMGALSIWQKMKLAWHLITTKDPIRCVLAHWSLSN